MTVETRIGRTPFPLDALDVIERIIRWNVDELSKNPAEDAHGYLLHVAVGGYLYGVMQGKRAERARRKGKAAIGAGTPTTAVDTMQDRQSVKCEYNTEARDMEGVNE